MKKAMKNYRFPLILFISVVIGTIIGVMYGTKAQSLKPLGDIFLNLMFTLVVPLVFFSITSAIANMAGGKGRFGKVIGSTFSVFIVMGIVSAIIMVIAVKLFPGTTQMNVHLAKPDSVEKVSAAEQIVNSFTTDNFINLFTREHMLALILFSLLLGFSISLVGEKAKPVARFMEVGAAIFTKMVNIIMYYAPIGLGAYFANLVGTFGTDMLQTYLKSSILYLVVSLLFFFIIYTLLAFAAGGTKAASSFWKNAISPSLTSLATCSSMATLPVNLEASGKMGIPQDIRETVLPLGASMHKDGSVLGEILKIAVLFSVFHMNFSGFTTLGIAILVAVLGGTVMGAIPSGGMIAEMLVISLYGFPTTALPIIAAIATIIDAPATMLNAVGDNIAAMLVSRSVEGKNWMNKESMKIPSNDEKLA